MADIKLNNLDGIPFGINSGRPTNPQPGQPYFNGEANRLEIYTQTVGWQNIVQETPSVVNIGGVYKESLASNTLTINGSNFAVGCTAYAIGTNGVEYQATTTTLVSVVQLSVVFTGLSKLYEPYDIKVVNPSNLYGILYDCLPIDEQISWTTSAGTLGTYTEQSPMSVSVVATDPENQSVTYSVTSGSLPGGLSLNSSTGVISGTPTDIISNTNYAFTITATDGQNILARNFSITVTDRGPSWSTSATLPTFTYNSAYSTTLVATDDNGIASYSLTAGSLPTGLSLNGSTGVISGTPTTATTSIFTIRATDNGGSYVDRQFTLPNASPTWTTTSPIASGSGGAAYSLQLVATDDSGNAPTYSIVSGALPAGLTLSSSGLISGTPTSVGSFTFTVRAQDINSNSTDRSFSLSIAIGVNGGTQTSDATYYYRTFTGNGTFSVVGASLTADLLVVGGGGSGGDHHAGGGGAGGVLYKTGHVISDGSSISVQVGGGGAASSSGTDSYFGVSGPIGFGGGNGGREWNSPPCSSGGSGGGAGGNGGSARGQFSGASSTQTSNNGGTGYGNSGGAGGGNSSGIGGGGGGGAGGAGGTGTNNTGGSGGAGITLMGFPVAAGGAGSSSDVGNAGSTWGNGVSATGYAGNAPANTGSGGNGGGGSGLGGSGKVIIRYTRAQVGG